MANPAAGLWSALVGHAGPELSADPAFAGRVRRLVVVSAVALGVVALLALIALPTHALIDVALIAGWVLMPSTLALSLRRPIVRVAALAPASLVSAGLLAICASALPAEDLGRAGWILLTAGILVGGSLGGWFWLRLAPVPDALDGPFAAGRWALVGVHVSLVAVGLALALASELGA